MLLVLIGVSFVVLTWIWVCGVPVLFELFPDLLLNLVVLISRSFSGSLRFRFCVLAVF